MIHSIFAGALYVAMVLTPCAIALFSGADRPDSSSESDVLRDGFL